MTQTPEYLIAEVLERLALEQGGSGLASVPLLAAVSGGADSIALLHILVSLAPRFGYVLSAVTVNHMIREADISIADSLFVSSLCASFDPIVPCHVVHLVPGEVSREAKIRGGGIEDAARAIRYRHFDEIAEREGIPYILTAHTETDQLETILMRFFQGSGGSALGGIAWRRGRYVRPMLKIRKGEVLAWLRDRGLCWREDATNGDDVYLRNRLRLGLVPVLSALIPGWESGIFNAAQKSLSDDDFCKSKLSLTWERVGDRLKCRASDFGNLHPALRLRFLQDGLNLLAIGRRVSFALLDRMVNSPERCAIAGSGLTFKKEGDFVFFSRDIVQNTKSGYLIYVCACGIYSFPFGTIEVSGEKESVFLDGRMGPFKLPLTVRSRRTGDSVSTSDGKKKTLKKLMNDWSIPEHDRSLLPVIEECGVIRGVFGSPLGYPDWFVHI